MDGKKLSLKIISILLLLFTWQNSSSQITPEVYVGGRYIPEYNFFAKDMSFPIAVELGGGISFHNKWYTGANVFYYGKRYQMDGYNYNSDIYQLELEFRRSFHAPVIPKLGVDLSLRPGLLVATLAHNNTSYPMGTYFDETKYTVSASAGLSYLVTDNVKLSVWPGITWIYNENISFSDVYIKYYFGAGLTYRF